MKIGIAQINTTTGDFSGNFQKILASANSLRELGADCVVFPELALCGCLPKDKVLSQNFLKQNEDYLAKLASTLKIACAVGCVRKSGGARGAYNSLAWIEGGEIKAYCDKCLLPNYGIFDELRYFDSGESARIIEFKGERLALTICEDIWSLDSATEKFYSHIETPLTRLKNEKIDCLVNISASLWSAENEEVRAQLLLDVAKYVNAPFVFCNLVGGNDEIVCAGKSAVITKGGNYALSLKKFEEDFDVVDTNNLFACPTPPFERIAEMYMALKISLADFVRKSGFKKVLLGLSGGIDSAFIAALAADALGGENVIGIMLPSKHSSDHSVNDAQTLAQNCALVVEKISIEGVVDSAEKALAKIFENLPRDVTEENLQSRARGMLLMAISNKFGAMLLATGNKSECAVGYCTLYGDTNGGFAPIADVYKTDIFKLSRHLNSICGKKIPENSIIKPPSAELRPDQKDCDSLPEYHVLDSILRAYIEERKSVADIIAFGFDADVVKDVVKKFEQSEYKRRQLPPSPRLTCASFGPGRRVALTDKKHYEFI